MREDNTMQTVLKTVKKVFYCGLECSETNCEMPVFTYTVVVHFIWRKFPLAAEDGLNVKELHKSDDASLPCFLDCVTIFGRSESGGQKEPAYTCTVDYRCQQMFRSDSVEQTFPLTFLSFHSFLSAGFSLCGCSTWLTSLFQ